MTKQDIIGEVVEKFEGGYCNHKKDRGGETYCGIARKKHPSWEGWKTIDMLKDGRKLTTKAEWKEFSKVLDKHQFLRKKIEAFYDKEYWEALRLSSVASEKVQHELFDTGVNCGISGAVRVLQEALNTLNRNNDSRLYADLVVDGKIGMKTLNAANMLLPRDEGPLMKALNGEQYIRYKKIIKKDPSQEIFWRSWMRRVSF